MSDRAPEGLSPRARALWDEVLDGYELAAHERALLVELCRTATVLDALDEHVRREGLFERDHVGNRRLSPAVVELRQSRITLARLSAALGLPSGVEDDGTGAGAGAGASATSARHKPRGVYQLRAG